MNIKKSAYGFTLIELLIAMALLSSVVIIASMSFSVFSNKWLQHTSQFDDVSNDMRVMLALQKSIQGISNYLVANQAADTAYYFYGSHDRINFITNTPVFSSSAQAIAQLKVIDTEDGYQRLLYRESPVDTLIQGWPETPVFLYEQTVLHQQENIRFNFFGWVNLEQRAAFYGGQPFQPEWQSHYDGRKNGVMPFAINLSWHDNEPVIFPLRNDNMHLTIFTHGHRSGA